MPLNRNMQAFSAQVGGNRPFQQVPQRQPQQAPQVPDWDAYTQGLNTNWLRQDMQSGPLSHTVPQGMHPGEWHYQHWGGPNATYGGKHPERPLPKMDDPNFQAPFRPPTQAPAPKFDPTNYGYGGEAQFFAGPIGLPQAGGAQAPRGAGFPAAQPQGGGGAGQAGGDASPTPEERMMPSPADYGVTPSRAQGGAARGTHGRRVICTELVRQGLMTPRERYWGTIFIRDHIPEVAFEGYLAWAVPMVRVMRRNDRLGRAATWLMAQTFIPRAQEIMSYYGKAEPSRWGWCMRKVVEPFSWCVGQVTRRLGRKADPATLYNSSYPEV